MLFGPPPPGLEVQGLDLGDASELDPKTHAHEDIGAGLAHRPHHGNLTELRIGEDVAVVADTLGGLPEPVADVDHLIVLGVFHVFRKRHLRRVVGDHGFQVLVDEVFETRAIAVEGNWTGGAAHACGERPETDSGRNGKRRDR